MPDENREFYEFEEEDIREWFKNNYEGSSPVICPVCKSTDRWGLNSKIPLIELKGISADRERLGFTFQPYKDIKVRCTQTSPLFHHGAIGMTRFSSCRHSTDRYTPSAAFRTTTCR